MNRQYLLLLTGVFLIFFMRGVAQQSGDAGTTEIIILHTNDMHAKIDNLPKLAYLADSLRKTHPFVFVVAAGDNFTGNPVVDMIPDKGYPMIDLMNRCGFDLSCIGNHEFDMGQELLNKRIAQAKFPFISCNINATGAVLKQPQPYAVLKAGKDISMAFLGVIELNENGIPDSHPSNLKGLKFTNGLVKAKEFSWLKEKYGILIGLTHLGVDDDVRLADSMPQFDLIIGGHSHTLIEKPMIENGVMILQAGANLRYIGKTTLQVKNGKVVDRRDEIIPIARLTRGVAEMQAIVDKYNANEEFNKVVGEAEEPLNGLDELGSLMCDAMTDGLKIDIAFQNKGGIRILSLPKGEITLKNIYQLDPFGNQVVVFKMNEAEIKSLICNAYNMDKDIDLQVSGLTYTVYTGASGSCTRVEVLDKTGKLLDPSKDYTVGLSTYVAVTYKFDHRDAGSSYSVTTAELLINYLKKQKTVNYSGVKRTGVSK